MADWGEELLPIMKVRLTEWSHLREGVVWLRNLGK